MNNLAKISLFLLMCIGCFHSAYALDTKLSANAGNSQTVFVNAKQVITLMGSANNASGGVKRWYWQQLSGPKVNLTASLSKNASFKTTIAGNYLFMLTVTDKRNSNAYATTSVTVLDKSISTSRLSLISSENTSQTISLDQDLLLSWQVKNISGIDLANVVLTTDAGASTVNEVGGIKVYRQGNTNAVIEGNTPLIINWKNNEVLTFQLAVNAKAKTAGSYHHQWTFKQQNSSALLFNSGQAMQYNLTVPANIKLSLKNTQFNSKSYQAGQFVLPNETNNLTWTVNNDSNLNLSNVTLSPGSYTGDLQIASISPDHIDNWQQNTTQTFTVSVKAPNTIAGGHHQQNWAILYNNQNYLTFGFSLNTPSVTLSLIKSLFTDDNSSLTDGAIINPASSRTLNWQVKNDSNIALTNLSFSNSHSGQLAVTAITPNTLDTWAIGETKTFAVTVTAPADVISGRHNASWQLKYNNQPINLADNKTIAYSLTTSPAQCAVTHAVSANQSNLIKYDNAGKVKLTSDTQWQCVKDNYSGLMWEVKTSANTSLTYSWDDAVTYAQTVNNQGLCGETDWRLPSAEELASLVSARQTDVNIALASIINSEFFPNTQKANYWTRSDSENAEAWAVSFMDGSVQLQAKSVKQAVRLVRVY